MLQLMLMLFRCTADNLFGNCQSRSHVDGSWADSYQYHLTGAQLSELYLIVLRLVAEGYTWHHHHTQCLLYTTLSRYRHGSIVDNIPLMCADFQLLDSQFQPNIVNSSQSGMSPNARGSPQSSNYDRAFSKFKKFMQNIQADDLSALKQFLLDDSSYKRPVSDKAVFEPTKPSVMPIAQDHPGMLF